VEWQADSCFSSVAEGMQGWLTAERVSGRGKLSLCGVDKCVCVSVDKGCIVGEH